MTRKLVYTQDSIGEYTVADETEKWVTVVGQVESESDAKLFCAAPELLATLIKCADALEEVSYQAWCGEIIDEARAAINKATGETK